MQLPPGQKAFSIVEVRFKGSRKEFFRNQNGLEIYMGEAVAVETENGYDVGHISLKGELVRLQLKKFNITEDDDRIKSILRLANERDMEKYKEVKAEEKAVLQRAREIALQLKLSMKISDIEFQADRKKVTFYYTAEERVDFRELIKKYADEFKTRIDMRQISYRHEASRLGAIGSCGRELCCSTWLTDFKQVNISAARYQNLSLNPLKLQGQCGRLKCCLNYELDTYLEVLADFPSGNSVKIETEDGLAVMQKSDILKQTMWFSYLGSQAGSEWIPLSVKEVNALLTLNKEGKKAPALAGFAPEKEKEKVYETVEMEGSLNRLDNKGNKKKKPLRGNRNNNRPGGNRPPQQRNGSGKQPPKQD